MNIAIKILYEELARWRDSEIKRGNMNKARRIQKVIARKREYTRIKAM